MPFVAQPTEKCEGCGKTVYATEKTIVEDKERKRVFHKSCIRCTSCNKVLGLGDLSSQEGVFYCKPHWKQLFASKGNYDEAFGKEKATDKWTAQTTTSPKSFIPETGDSSKASEKKETSESTLSKIKQFQAEGESNKCTVCTKTVYLAEKMILEDRSGKKLLHKLCFKCENCKISLNLENYGFVDGKYYCKNHLKELTKVAPTAVAAVSTGQVNFVPAPTKEETNKKGETPDHIAAKFKGFSENADRCVACNKLVYLNEKLVIGELTKQSLYHKTCFRCKHCNIQCDVSNYGSSNGVIYCKIHLKTVARAEQAKSENGYFISPLAQKNTGGYVPTGVALDSDGQPQPSFDDEKPTETSTQEEPQETTTTAQEEPASEEPQETAVETVTEELKSTDLNESAQDEEASEEDRKNERQRKAEERRRQKEEQEKQEEEERQRRRAERDQLRSEVTSSSDEPASDARSDRQRRREERERQEKEEEAKREEERKKRQEERKKRLEEASN